MRAMRLERPAPIARRPLILRDLEELLPAQGELALRVKACAICRTDLQIAEGDVAAHRLPITPGHQVVGIVEAIGADVKDWKVGDRAGVAWLGGADGVCRYCASGRENLCPNASFTGWDRDGGFAERIIARADYALRLPPSFSDTDAAPLLCGGIIGYRALKRSGILPGRRLGLYGFGASARLAIQVALHWGCEVFVRTRSKKDQEEALALGAVDVANYERPTPAPLDAAVTFAPVGSVVIEALKSLAPSGTVAINAIHLDQMPAFNYDLLWGERNLNSVANFTRADANEFLELAARIPIKTATRTFALQEANEALAAHAAGDVQGAAVLIP
jgi:propanol-preferring alcohol dehydrogenase